MCGSPLVHRHGRRENIRTQPALRKLYDLHGSDTASRYPDHVHLGYCKAFLEAIGSQSTRVGATGGEGRWRMSIQVGENRSIQAPRNFRSRWSMAICLHVAGRGHWIFPGWGVGHCHNHGVSPGSPWKIGDCGDGLTSRDPVTLEQGPIPAAVKGRDTCQDPHLCTSFTASIHAPFQPSIHPVTARPSPTYGW